LSITLGVRGLPLILLPLVLAGCALTGKTSAPVAPSDDGVTRYEISAGDFSIAVPDTWRVTTSEQIHKRGLQTLLHENPALAPLLERSGSKFVAYDPHVQKRFAASAIVSVSPEPKRMTAAAFGRAALARAKAAAAGKVRKTDVTLPAGGAVRLTYHVDLAVHGQKRPVSALQYAFLLRNKGYVLTYVTLPAYEGEYDYVFKRSAASFRLTKS
jgi:hypothetical protein